MRSCCMCFPKHIEQERFTGVRNQLLHVDGFSSASDTTAPLNSSTTLGPKAQEHFARKSFNLPSEQFSDVLRRAVPLTL